MQLERQKRIVATIITRSLSDKMILRKFSLKISQLRYLKSVIKDDNKFDKFMAGVTRGRPSHVTPAHVSAIREITTNFIRARFTCKNI